MPGRKVVKVYVPPQCLDALQMLVIKLGLSESEIFLHAFLAYAEKYGLITDTIRAARR